MSQGPGVDEEAGGASRYLFPPAFRDGLGYCVWGLLWGRLCEQPAARKHCLPCLGPPCFGVSSERVLGGALSELFLVGEERERLWALLWPSPSPVP